MRKVAILILFAFFAIAVLQACSDKLCPAYQSYPEGKKKKNQMRWIELNAIRQVNDIKAASGYSLIFKHSTRCSISLMVKRNLELNWDIIPTETEIYFLDLIAYRDISNYIAELFQARHESPQALLVKNGKCVLNLSHSDVTVQEIAEVIARG